MQKFINKDTLFDLYEICDIQSTIFDRYMKSYDGDSGLALAMTEISMNYIAQTNEDEDEDEEE